MKKRWTAIERKYFNKQANLNFESLTKLNEVPLAYKNYSKGRYLSKGIRYGTNCHDKWIFRWQGLNFIALIFLDFCFIRRRLRSQKHDCCPCFTFCVLPLVCCKAALFLTTAPVTGWRPCFDEHWNFAGKGTWEGQRQQVAGDWSRRWVRVWVWLWKKIFSVSYNRPFSGRKDPFEFSSLSQMNQPIFSQFEFRTQFFWTLEFWKLSQCPK